jgi:NTE family protein
MSSTNTRPTKHRNPPIENIVLSGGGILGICYAGAFQFMEEQGIRSGIRRILGVSVGSIFGFLFTLKIPAEHIHRLVEHFGPDDIKDIESENILQFFQYYGIDTGVKIERFIKACAKVKLGNPEATFADLYNYHPDMEFIVMGAEVTKSERIYFSYKTTPNYPIWKAIRISCSIPLYFRPIIDCGKIYVDGAAVCNYPIDYFRDDIENTLGFTFDEYIVDEEKEQPTTDISAGTGPTTSVDFYKYFSHVFETILYSFTRYMVSQYSDYTVYIRIPKIGLYDYSLQADTKQKYYNAGYSDMKKKWNERCKKYGIDDINESDDEDQSVRSDQSGENGYISNTSDDDDIHSIAESLRANSDNRID